MKKEDAPPMSLAEFFNEEKVKFALVIIDVQREFCDPEFFGSGSAHTKSIATDIARIAPEFRKQNIPIYIVYMDKTGEGYEKACGGPYLLEKAPSDILSSKYLESAITSGDLEQKLNEQNITHLLVMGFNSSACVFDTINDAIVTTNNENEDEIPTQAKFNVAMLEDCIGEDRGNHGQIGYNLNALEKSGAIRTNSTAALEHIAAMPS